MSGSTARPLSLGVLGAANIARAFIAAMRGSAKIVVAAVASRDPARAAAFARDTGVARVHPTYDALLADPAIEAVYVPLANALQSWRERDRQVRLATGKDPSSSEAIIIADSNTPYRLLTEVLFTLGQSEFAKFHLMVMQSSKK